MTVDTTIFPRINFIKTFGDRLVQRIANGRVAMFFQRVFALSGPTAVTIEEDNTAVATYYANRPVQTWSLTGADAALFTLTTGLVTFNSPAVIGSYTYTVNATDSEANTESITTVVTVTADSTAPVISGNSSVSINEGDTAIGTYTANEPVTWSLSGTDAASFAITSGGVVTFTGGGVFGSYSFNVVGTDGRSNVGTRAVTVTVNDVTPAIITGNATPSTDIGSVVVASYTANETVTWSLSGTDAGLFSISTGGVVTYNTAPTVVGTTSFNVVATDQGSNVTVFPVSGSVVEVGGAALDLNFAVNKTLVDDVSGNNLITFTRASTGTYVDSNGVIQTAAIDTPRFDHDPTTNASLGLLIEESRTNLVTNSTNPTWTDATGGTGTTPTVTLVSDAAPDGSTNSAQRFQFDRGTGNTSNDYSLVSITTSAASVLHSVSVWMRSNDSNTYTLIFYDAGGQKGEEIIVTPSWKRYVLDASTSYKGSNQNSYSSPNLIFGLRNDPPAVGYFTGNNNSQTADILAWGPQIEAGTFPTSYIPTSGTTVTRAEDLANITGTNFSSWYNDTGVGTWYYESSAEYTDYSLECMFSVGSNTNGYSVIKNFSVNGVRISSKANNGGGTLDLIVTNAWTQGGPGKWALGLEDNNVKLYHSSGNSGADTACTVPIVGSATNLSLRKAGQTSLAYTGASSTIARLAYYPTRLTDTELQDLTT